MGLLDSLQERVAPLPTGRRMIAAGVYGTGLPVRDRAEALLQGRQLLAGPERAAEERRSLVEGAASGARLGIGSVLGLYLAEKVLGARVDAATQARRDQAAAHLDQVITRNPVAQSALASAFTDEFRQPLHTAGALSGRWYDSLARQALTAPDPDTALLEAQRTVYGAPFASGPRGTRPTMLPDDVVSLYRGPLAAATGSDQAALDSLLMLTQRARDNSRPFAPDTAAVLDDAIKDALHIEGKAGVFNQLAAGTRKGLRRAVSAMGQPVPGTRRVPLFAAAVPAAAVLGAGVAGVRSRLRRDEMRDLAGKSVEETEAEILRNARSTAEALAAELRPTRDLDRWAARSRNLGGTLTPDWSSVLYALNL